MVQLRTRNIDTFATTRTGAQIRITYLRSNWQSNRESGQIVKRESAFGYHYARYTRFDPKVGSLDVGNEGVTYNSSVWSVASSTAYGRAYAAFKREAAMPQAEMLLNVVERKKSLEMIAARAFQLKEIVRNVRRGRLGDAWEFMTMNPNATLRDMSRKPAGSFAFKHLKERERMVLDGQRWRTFVKDVGSLILEIRYGWTPIIKDLMACVGMLSEPIPDNPIKVVKSHRYSTGTAPFQTHYSERVTIVGKIRVSNPNLDLTNRLGLLNIPYVVWDAIPFSCVFDWVLPVGNYLQSFTDFVGLELIDGSYTGTLSGSTPQGRAYVYTGSSGTNLVINENAYSVYSKRIVRVPTSSLPRPPLLMGTGLSPGRALNAVGLLLQLVRPQSARSAYG